ncbi:UDP-N-acetylglucosamine 1-carboxyvinyltransferase [uncultured Exiguobacterium sp.]|uniref:UDP-N-acetylglucosamine 1-carboxyvinyltransferase n=1 Tax=uncultured Exiguobacterium sp. TaxID=202669 RepID=UPI0025D97F02|nr:UDP-N-acetylglucosamine 1-carboxyvinyltransferase [uncultured Exiguobacterium sp.]
MDILHIVGQQRLEGTVSISGSKQSAIPCLAAALLTDQTVVLEGVPEIGDVATMIEILETLGAVVTRQGDMVTIDPSRVESMPLTGAETRKLRGSIYLMSVLAARFKQGVVGLPGGYAIGPRPIDLHIKALERLGVSVRNEQGVHYMRVDRLVGNRIYLDLPSFGATISALLVAVFAEGTTVIENAAYDPEVIDVSTMLTNMGASVKGAGTDEIRIKGVSQLSGCRHTLIPDRMEAGTFLTMGAALGRVTVDNVIPLHLESVIQKLERYGALIEATDDSVTATFQEAKPVDIRVFHYGGFPSDLQPVISAALLQAKGASIVVDKLYPQRFRHVQELRRLNARITHEDASIIIRGGENLLGTEIEAPDPRGGAALVLAGLLASGETTLHHAEVLDQSYERFDQKLKELGALVWRETI